MADLFSVAGAKFYIGGVKPSQDAAFVEADFVGESWVLVDGWMEMGEAGDSAQLIETDLINRGRTVKQKGTRNAGSSTQRFAVIPTDAGQIAVLAAEGTQNNYAFRIVFDDAPVAGPAPEGTTRYFIGLVTSARETGGGANTVRQFECTVEINSNVVSVAANDGS